MGSGTGGVKGFKVGNNIDLELNQLLNAVLQNLSSAPGSAVNGLIYYDTTLNSAGLYKSGTWDYILTAGLLGSTSGIATLNSSSLVTQLPAAAQTISGGAANEIPLSNSSGKLDTGWLPALNYLPTPTNSLSMGNQALTNLLDPVNPQDGATKNYVDLNIQGFKSRTEVIVATTSNITLSGLQVIDTYTTLLNDRVLVFNQTNAAQNGVYLAQTGAWTRSMDYATWADLYASYVAVTGGSANKGVSYSCNAPASGTLGTTAIPYTQFASVQSYSGTNLGTGVGQVYQGLSGTVLNFRSIKNTDTTITITNNANDITLSVNQAALSFLSMTNSGILGLTQGGTGAANAAGAKTNLGFLTKFTETIGDGSTTAFTINHNLGTTAILFPSLIEISTGNVELANFVVVDANNMTVTFSTPPTLNQFSITIAG